MVLVFILVAFLLLALAFWLRYLSRALFISQSIETDTPVEIKSQTEPLQRLLSILRDGEKEQQTVLFFSLERDLLKHRNPSVRYKIAQALGQIKDVRAIDALMLALNDPDRYVRFAAADALGSLGEQGVKALERALHDRNRDMRIAAAWGLRHLGKQGLVILEAALRDRDKGVRHEAAWGLAYMGEEGVKALKAALEDSNEEVRREAESQLKATGWAASSSRDGGPNVAAGTNYLNLLVSSVAPLFRTLKYTGEAVLPKKVYMGDAENISLVMKSMGKIEGLLPEKIRVQGTKVGQKVDLEIQQRDRSEQFLEVELQAAAFTVDGEKKQRCLLGQETISYQWNCYFPNSGNQTLTLVLRVIHSSGNREVGTISHSIKVAKLDHLTQRQIGMLTWLTGAAGFLSTIIGIVGALLHLFGSR